MGKKQRNFTRICALADLHSGAKYGLTHHARLPRPPDDAPHKVKAVYDGRREMTTAFYEMLREEAPYDVAIVNGDMVDGPGEKSMGVEVWQGDPEWQTANAVALIKKIGAKEHIFVRGTRYHTRRWVDLEKQIAQNMAFDSDVYSHPFVKIAGVWFDIKHKMTRTSSYGKASPMERARMHNAFETVRENQPLARVILRAHSHRFFHVGDGDWTGIALPSLQGPSEFGETDVEGSVDFGFVVIDVHPEGRIEWRKKIRKLDVLKSKRIVLK